MCYWHLKMLESKEHDWQISMAKCDNLADAVRRFLKETGFLKETREKLNLAAFTDDYKEFDSNIISSYPPCFSPKNNDPGNNIQAKKEDLMGK